MWLKEFLDRKWLLVENIVTLLTSNPYKKKLQKVSCIQTIPIKNFKYLEAELSSDDVTLSSRLPFKLALKKSGDFMIFSGTYISFF